MRGYILSYFKGGICIKKSKYASPALIMCCHREGFPAIMDAVTLLQRPSLPWSRASTSHRRGCQVCFNFCLSPHSSLEWPQEPRGHAKGCWWTFEAVLRSLLKPQRKLKKLKSTKKRSEHGWGTHNEMPFIPGFLALCGLITVQATGTGNAVVSRDSVAGGSWPSSPPALLARFGTVGVRTGLKS